MNRPFSELVIATAVLFGFSYDLCAQTVRRIEVQVTASSGVSVYLDNGRAAGIEPGDQVLLYPPSQAAVKSTVQSVSRTSARCSLPSGVTRVDLGTRGEVLIPEGRQPSAAGDPATESKPDDSESPVLLHPPWTNTEGTFDSDTPLLAPARALKPNERESQLHGRVYSQYVNIWDRSIASNEYSLGRLGSVLWIQNPFGKGGGLTIDGEVYHRQALLDDATDDISTRGMLRRLSYHQGGTDDDALRFEVGRFLHHEFPEFGILDGAEFVYRTESGDRVGFSVGALPEWFPDLPTGDDLETAIFYRFVADTEERLMAGIGYQKTWHQGSPDRDLVVGTLDFAPSDRVSLYGSVLADIYTSDDEFKSSGLEITEAHAHGTLQFNPGHGVGVFLAYFRWPELARKEFSPAFDFQLQNYHVLRYGVFTWQQLTDQVRIDARVDQWHDQNDDGTAWETRLAARDWLYDKGEVALSVFNADAVYTSGLGGRLSASRLFAWGFGSIAYDIVGFELDDTALQHVLHANFDMDLKRGRSASLFCDYRFGENQDSFQIGVLLQQRF
jgi:hypothetical protein